MILKGVLNLIKNLLFMCFSWINLPDFPAELSASLEEYLEIIFQGINLFGFFIRPLTIQIVLPLILIIINFDKIYKITMWILRKIPMLGIK